MSAELETDATLAPQWTDECPYHWLCRCMYRTPYGTTRRARLAWDVLCLTCNTARPAHEEREASL